MAFQQLTPFRVPDHPASHLLCGHASLACHRKMEFCHASAPWGLDTHGRVFRGFEGGRWSAEDLAEAIIQSTRR